MLLGRAHRGQDPERTLNLVRQAHAESRALPARTTRTDPLSTLTPRERDVVENMAQGLNNTAIAERLYVSPSAVEKHINAIFDKFDLAHTPEYSRRVLAVLRFPGT